MKGQHPGTLLFPTLCITLLWWIQHSGTQARTTPPEGLVRTHQVFMHLSMCALLLLQGRLFPSSVSSFKVEILIFEKQAQNALREI